MGSVRETADIAGDQALVARAKAHPEAFGEIFDRFYEPIFRYVLRRVGSSAVAEDVVATTFLKAFRGLNRYQWKGIPLSAWLYRIAGNEIAMHQRGRFWKITSLDELLELGFDPTDEQMADERNSIDELIREDEQYKKVHEVLVALPPRYQEVLALRYTEGKKTEEIAVILGKREGTVRSLLSRGTRLLKERVQQKEAHCIIESEGSISPIRNTP